MDTLAEGVKKACLERMREAIRAGDLNLYGTHMGGHGSTVRPGEASVNITRFGGDCTDVEDLTKGELLTRDLTWRVMELWRSVPGAEGLYLIATPTHVGLRESRQVVGGYWLTGPDVVEARKFDDAVARCGYWIDIHCPRGLVEGGDVHLCSIHCKKTDCYMLTDHADQLPDEMYPPEGDWFEIPYRSLVPREMDGLVISGRCISGDHQAMGAYRVMGPCMAIGQAAGTAAAMAALDNSQPRNVDVSALRDRLTADGAML
jgi:hypothetical protein